jgi:hypothetical protein
MKVAGVHDRLEGVRDPEEAIRILGRGWLVRWGLVPLALAGAALGCGIYLVVQASAGQQSWWTLLFLPAVLAVGGYFGLLVYGSAYVAVTGRRPPNATGINRFFERLNSNN